MLFAKKAAPPVIGGATPIFGKKFDLVRVLFAYEQLFDTLTAKFGNGRSRVSARSPGLVDGVDWPYPGKAGAVAAWKGWSCGFDAVGEEAAHQVGPVNAKAYVLAKGWTVYDPVKGTHTLHDGRPLKALDTAPVVEIYGRSRGEDACGMNEVLAEKVRGVIVSDLAKFGFTYTTSSFSRSDNGVEIVGMISFPHSIYGAGEDWLRVRCVGLDGSEVRSALGGN